MIIPGPDKKKSWRLRFINVSGVAKSSIIQGQVNNLRIDYPVQLDVNNSFNTKQVVTAEIMGDDWKRIDTMCWGMTINLRVN